MKKSIILFGIIFLIITTSIVKSSTRQLEKKIFIMEEEVKILEEKYNFLLLENDYLTTPERLIGLKEKIFKDKFFPINPKDIKKINTNE
jgi:ABC-type lipoprotein release transport system permease subunit